MVLWILSFFLFFILLSTGSVFVQIFCFRQNWLMDVTQLRSYQPFFKVQTSQTLLNCKCRPTFRLYFARWPSEVIQSRQSDLPKTENCWWKWIRPMDSSQNAQNERYLSCFIRTYKVLTEEARQIDRFRFRKNWFHQFAVVEINHY